MAEKKLIIETDLGGGDGGKGGVVHKICIETNAHTVIKVGGAQGSHGVRTARGQSFNFSQFGCGAFEGVRTHISKLLVFDPLEFVHEGQVLKYEHGLRDIFDTVTIDEDALCVTPFHRISSQIREMARKDNPKGTIGTGVGEAFSDSELFPDLLIRVKDLSRPDLCDKLWAVREQKICELSSLIASVEDFWESDQPLVKDLIDALRNPMLVKAFANRFNVVGSFGKIVDQDYFRKDILARDGTAVFECSHGVLTDRYYGFHPHTSKLRTVPDSILKLVAESDYDGRVIRLGVTRAYQIRHGAGPMVTERPEMLDNLLPGSNKDENRWQGKVRVGPLDFVALRYAINACGGPSAFDGIALTWFDQIIKNESWSTCDLYIGADNEKFFDKGEIRVRRGQGKAQLEYQEHLGKLLRTCHPSVVHYWLTKDMDQEDLIKLCQDVIMEKLHLPIKMISFGPTEDNKVCL